MVVADCAAGRQPEPDLRDGLGAVASVEHLILFGDRATFVGGHVAAVESRGDLLFECAARQKVAGKLIDGEAIEGQVAVIGPDEPVAVGPGFAEIVKVIAVGIGVARGVEPVTSTMLAPAGRGEQPRHQLVRRHRGRGRQRTPRPRLAQG